MSTLIACDVVDCGQTAKWEDEPLTTPIGWRTVILSEERCIDKAVGDALKSLMPALESFVDDHTTKHRCTPVGREVHVCPEHDMPAFATSKPADSDTPSPPPAWVADLLRKEGGE